MKLIMKEVMKVKNYLFLIVFIILSTSSFAFFESNNYILAKCTPNITLCQNQYFLLNGTQLNVSGSNFSITPNSFQCGLGNYLYNVSISSTGLLNGLCRPDQIGSGSFLYSDSFNQYLNTTNDVNFNTVTANNFYGGLDWSYLTGGVPALSFFSNDVGFITNAGETDSTITGGNCLAGYVVQNISNKGVPNCILNGNGSGFTMSNIALDSSRIVGSTQYANNVLTQTDLEWSAGIISGGNVSKNSDGTINISSGEAKIREYLHTCKEAQCYSPLYSIQLTAVNNVNLTEGLNYCYFDYNGGSPVQNCTTDKTSINCEVRCYNGIAVKENTTVYFKDAKYMNIDANTKDRVQKQNNYNGDGNFRCGSGKAILSNVGLNITLSSDTCAFGLNSDTFNDFDTGVVGTTNQNVFDYYYRNGTTGFYKVTNQKLLNVTKYDDGSGTLASVTLTYYTVQDVYVIIDSTTPRLVVMYGQAQYSLLTDAQQSSLPSLPPVLQGLGFHVGRFVIQQGAVSPATVYGWEGITYSNSAGVDGNNYPTSISFTNPTLTLSRNGLADLTATINLSSVNETSKINQVNTSLNMKLLGFNLTSELQNLFYSINNPSGFFNSSNATQIRSIINNSGFYNITINCSNIVGGSDGDYCTDAGGSINGTPINVSSIIVSTLTSASCDVKSSLNGTLYCGNDVGVGNASTGNCPSGQVVQNTTLTGVQCITPTASANAGGSNLSIQYNLDGAIMSAGNVSITSEGFLWVKNTTEPTPPTSGEVIFSEDRGEHSLFAVMDKSGNDRYMQTSIAYEDVVWCNPAHGAVGTTIHTCTAGYVAGVGTVSNPLTSFNNVKNSMNWNVLNSTANITEHKALGLKWGRGNSALGLSNGGFHLVQTFFIGRSDENMTGVFGMTSVVSAYSYNTNAFYTGANTANNLFVGFNKTETTLSIWTSNATQNAVQKIVDCGSPFYNVTNPDNVFQLDIFAKKNGDNVSVYLRRLDNTSIPACQYTFNSADGRLPVATTPLGWRMFLGKTNSTSAVSVASFGMNKVYISTDK